MPQILAPNPSPAAANPACLPTHHPYSPSQVDTPEGLPARQRFDKYRGLKSYRTSAWDPRESLPQDYARVFAFENFKR